MTAASERLDAAEVDVELDDIVDRLANDPDADATAGPTILDLDRADRALRRLARLDASLGEAEALYRQRLAELDAWWDGEKRRHERAASWLRARLRAFHAERIEADPKALTVRLPAGELRSREGQPAWEFDDDAFIAWATDVSEDLLDRHPKIRRNDVKKAFADLVGTGNDGDQRPKGRVVLASGEIVPGITVHPAERTYTPAPNPIGGGVR